MRWLTGEEQKERVLLLVLKRHFVFKSREKNVKHLESRILSVQSFEHNFHWFHRTCCSLVAVSLCDLWTQVMGSWISAQRSWWSSSGGQQKDLSPGSDFRICRPAFEGLSIENLAWVCLITNWFLALSKRGLAPLKFDFLSCESGWDFWCDWSVCMWLTEGRGFCRTQTLINTWMLFLQQVSILSHFGNGGA